MARLIAPLLFGLIGTAILISLGIWQMQRLSWKQAILTDIDTRIAAAPVALPAEISAARDKYLPVITSGTFEGPSLRVLASRKHVGAGYRIITPLITTDGRRVLIDRGFVPVEAPWEMTPSGQVTVVGNLHWPDELNASTPAPDPAANLWFARDVPMMSEALETAPILIVAREIDRPSTELKPLPVNSAGIPNDHLQYAITWFSLAVIWLVMTAFYLIRTNPAKDT